MAMKFKIERGQHVVLTREKDEETGDMKVVRKTYEKGDIITSNDNLEERFNNHRLKRFSRVHEAEMDDYLKQPKKPKKKTAPPEVVEEDTPQEETVVAVAEPDTEAYTRDELEQMKVVDLEGICEEFGIDTSSVRKSARFKKSDLITAILGE